MKRFKKIALLGLCGFLAAGLALAVLVTFVLPADLVHERDSYQAMLAPINPENGIDRIEAEAIAEVYSVEFIIACGGPDKPKLEGGAWVAQVRIGYGGRLSEQFVRIDARTGAVSSTTGPSYPSFRSFRTSVLWGIAWRRILPGMAHLYW